MRGCRASRLRILKDCLRKDRIGVKSVGANAAVEWRSHPVEKESNAYTKGFERYKASYFIMIVVHGS